MVKFVSKAKVHPQILFAEIISSLARMLDMIEGYIPIIPINSVSYPYIWGRSWVWTRSISGISSMLLSSMISGK